MSDYLKLSNGKQIYCHGGIIGLSEKPTDDHSYWSPSQGWDAGLPPESFGPYFSSDDLEFDHITKVEMLEICDIMIARWQEYKKFVSEQKEFDKG